MFIDGVYRSRSGIGLNELGEIDRIEVLRGPQGTLFGRNASAGLIHIIIQAAVVRVRRLWRATYGNYDYPRVGGGVTGPLGDTARLPPRRGLCQARRLLRVIDAQRHDDVNDRNRFFVRGQLLFEPNDDLVDPADRRLYASATNPAAARSISNGDVNPLSAI